MEAPPGMAGGSEEASPEARAEKEWDGGEAGPGPGASEYEEGHGHGGVEARISSCHVAMPGIPMAAPGAPVMGMPLSTLAVPDALYTQRGLQASASGRDPGGTIGAAAPAGADDEPADPILVFGSLHRDLPLGAAGMSVPSFVQPLKLRQQLRMICLIHIAAIVITISTAGAADGSQVSLPFGVLSILFPLIGLRGVTAFKKEFIGLYLGFCIADSIFTCIFIGLVGFRGYAGGTSKLFVFFTEIFAANALIVLSKSLNLLSESELAMLRLGATGT